MRPRKTDRHLPACVYAKHGAYYLVQRGKWIRLGESEGEALREYASRRETGGEKMPDLMIRWMNDIQIATKTRQTYNVVVRQLSEILVEFTPAQVTARDIMAIMHHHRHKPGMANHMRTVLIGSLEYAFREQLVERNVARDVQPMATATRDRYITHGEFAAIWQKATPTMRAIMDISYLTGQRIGDVLAIRIADLGDDGITFKQQKTKNRLIVGWTDDLRAAVATARALHQSVKGMTLFHSRKGTPFTYSTVRTLWDRACVGAKVEDAHMHDIRAKAATDAKKQGIDSQALLGHHSESSHLRYLRSKETPIVTPVAKQKY
jgi:integrase